MFLSLGVNVLSAPSQQHHDGDQDERRLLLSTYGGELCSRALSIYDDDLGLAVIMLLRENATSLVRLAHMLEEQVCGG